MSKKKSQIAEEEFVEAYVQLIKSADEEIIIISNDISELSHPQIMEAIKKKADPLGYFNEHYTKGRKLASEGRYREAIIELEKVRELLEGVKDKSEFYPFLGVLYNILGICYLRSETPRRAEICFESSLHYNPEGNSVKKEPEKLRQS